jgi:hypothetical protein
MKPTIPFRRMQSAALLMLVYSTPDAKCRDPGAKSRH